MNVFVYGTLMKGNRNHTYLENELFLGNAVLENYGLYNVSAFFPGIIKQDRAAVKGEVYSVSETTLKKLDMLESEGSLYTRSLVPVTLESDNQNDNQKIYAYVYIWNRDVAPNTYIPFEQLPWKDEDPYPCFLQDWN